MRSIFSYKSYRDFLNDFIAAKSENKGLSFRYFARKAGISSPNFLQQVIAGKRALTESSAEKVARGLNLSMYERRYFIELVRFSRAKNVTEQHDCLCNLSRFAKLGTLRTREVESFHSSWLHCIVWEMVSLPNFVCTLKNLHERLGHIATEGELKRSLQFLLERGYVVPTDKPDVYTQENIRPESTNDIVNLDLRRKHQKFLELAIGGLDLGFNERENQGLVIAVSEEKIAHAKHRMREFIKSLAADLANDEQADRVVRIEMNLFTLTR